MIPEEDAEYGLGLAGGLKIGRSTPGDFRQVLV
jgi:hypothetical protein